MNMQRHVEFVGGPLDGHRHSFTHEVERLPGVARLMVSPEVLRVLIGEQKILSGPPTSTAVYSLSRDDEVLRYFHLATVAVESCSADSA